MNVVHFAFDDFKRGLDADSSVNVKYRSVKTAYENSVNLPLSEVTTEELELLLTESDVLLSDVLFNQYNEAVFTKANELKKGKHVLRNQKRRFL